MYSHDMIHQDVVVQSRLLTRADVYLSSRATLDRILEWSVYDMPFHMYSFDMSHVHLSLIYSSSIT